MAAESAPLRRIDLDRSCWLEHYVSWLTPNAACETLAGLMHESSFERRSIVLFGRRMLQPREIAWAGDLAYTYSRDRLEPRPWTPTLARLRDRVRAVVGHRFNHALLNLYRDGRDSMGAHSDDESELGEDPIIASLSLGATRRFVLRSKVDDGARDSIRIDLADGDLLVMRGATQNRYKHALPKAPKVDAARLNVTFRHILPTS